MAWIPTDTPKIATTTPTSAHDPRLRRCGLNPGDNLTLTLTNQLNLPANAARDETLDAHGRNENGRNEKDQAALGYFLQWRHDTRIPPTCIFMVSHSPVCHQDDVINTLISPRIRHFSTKFDPRPPQ